MRQISILRRAAALAASMLFISGCAKEVNTPPTPNSFDAEVTLTTENRTVASEPGSIPVQLVDALTSACPDLSPFAADPSSWVVISDEAAGSPYRMTLDGGDGGYIVVWFTPGDGTANIQIDDEYFDETNATLYYSGCETLAENPDLDVAVDATESTVEVEMFEVPNFVGNIQKDVHSWFFFNSTRVKVMHRFQYGLNPRTSCVVTGDGLVTGQSPKPGELVENTNRNTIVINVECDW